MELEERVAELERRLAALESRRTGPARPPSVSRWRLLGAGGAQGSSSPSWAPATAGCCSPGPCGCRRRSGTSGSTARSPRSSSTRTGREAAESFAALGHAVRLRLLREILGGRRTAAELAELEGLGTTGQIYHHLRQLTAAGLAAHRRAAAATRYRAPGWCRCWWCWPPPSRRRAAVPTVTNDRRTQGEHMSVRKLAMISLPLLHAGLRRPGAWSPVLRRPTRSWWWLVPAAGGCCRHRSRAEPRPARSRAADGRGRAVEVGRAGHRPLVRTQQPRRQGPEPWHARLRTDVRDRHRGGAGGRATPARLPFGCGPSPAATATSRPSARPLLAVADATVVRADRPAARPPQPQLLPALFCT